MKQTLAVVTLCLVMTGCTFLPRSLLSVQTDRPVPLDNVLEEIREERVLFIGEMHGDRKSHALERAVIQYLHEQGERVVIAFEMFPHTEQSLLNQWIDRSIDESQFIARYHRIVNLPFATYKNILRYARDNGIPVMAINAEKSLISAVAKGGITNAPEPLLEKLKFTPCSDDEAYSRMLGFSDGKQYHTNLLSYLCDGQRLRDAHMAYHIADILKSSDSKVVVMTGALHAIKAAVPTMLQKHTSVSFRVLIPDMARGLIQGDVEAEIADYLWY